MWSVQQVLPGTIQDIPNILEGRHPGLPRSASRSSRVSMPPRSIAATGPVTVPSAYRGP